MIERIALILKEEHVRAVFVLQPMLILERNRVANMPEIERKLFEFNVQSWQPNYETLAYKAVDFVKERERHTVAGLGGLFIDATTIYRGVKGQIFTDYAHLTPKANQILARHIGARIIPLIQSDIADR